MSLSVAFYLGLHVCQITHLWNYNLQSVTLIKVEKEIKIRNRYDQVPYLTRNTIWENNKTQENTIVPSGQLFLASDNKAVIN